MSAIDLQTEIVQMIKDENDTSILEAIRTLLYRVRQGQVEDDFTDECSCWCHKREQATR